MDRDLMLKLDGSDSTLYSPRITYPPTAASAEDGIRASSPAFSSTSTIEDEDGADSPVIPPLPEPTFNGHTVNLSTRTPPLSSVADQTSYYTASWGSPYQNSPSSSRSGFGDIHLTDSEGSSIHQLEFHTPFPRPAPTLERIHTDLEFIPQEGLVSAAVLANRARRGKTGLTEDWIRKHTGGEFAERNHWLSDGELSENSSHSGSIAGSSVWLTSEERDPQTPTLKTFTESLKLRDFKKGHKKQPTASTLRQEDFNPGSEISVMIPDPAKETEKEMTSKISSRPPTPPPTELEDKSSPSQVTHCAPASILTPVSIARVKKKIPWRGKNILVLLPIDVPRGQNSHVSYPMTGKEVQHMLKEWEQLGYDTRGFNLGTEFAFDDGGAQGQSRVSWPLLKDVLAERSQRPYKVNIPDKREWDHYVQELQEAKLRALGVSISGDDSSSTNPQAAPNLNRCTPIPYPPLPFSPPIPTSSNGSSHVHQNPFSPVTMSGAGLSTKQSSNQGSIASPLPLNTPKQGKYNPRQSISFPTVEHPFGMPFQFPPQLSPASWSQGKILHQQGMAMRGRSPSLHNLGVVVSPVSPFPQDGYFSQNPDFSLQIQQRQNLLQSQLTQSPLQLGSNRISPRLQEVKENVEESEQTPNKSTAKSPDVRQANHNASVSLQEEIDAAEYHLESQIQRELEHEDYSPHFRNNSNTKRPEKPSNHIRDVSAVTHGLADSRYAVDSEEEGPILHHPQPHSRGHSLSQRSFQDKDELATGSQETNQPGITAVKNETSVDTTTPPIKSSLNAFAGRTHRQAMSVNLIPWADNKSIHRENSLRRGIARHIPNMSTSKLNVGAKEFKFNAPTTIASSYFPLSMIPNLQGMSDSPSMLPFNRLHINPQAGVPSGSSSAASRFMHNPETGSLGNINPKAPAFPSRNGEFIFPPIYPGLGPNVLTSNPQTSLISNSAASISDASHTPIFGNIELSEHRGLPCNKKSKAIPIVRPDKDDSKVLEDEITDGCIERTTQGEEHTKKARNEKDDDNSLSVFDDPGPMQETNKSQTPENKPESVLKPLTDKENLTLFEHSPENNLPLQPLPADCDAEVKEPAERSIDVPPQPSHSDESCSLAVNRGNLPVGRDAVAIKGHKAKSSSLSAAAKPFKFKPSATLSASLPASKSPQSTESLPAHRKARVSSLSYQSPSHPRLPFLPKLVGLSGSRFASSPSPEEKKEVISSTITEERLRNPDPVTGIPSVDAPLSVSPKPQIPLKSFENNQENISQHEPTFEEIDAVIFQLNKNELAQETHNQEYKIQVQQNSHARCIKVPDLDSSSPIRLLPQDATRSAAPSPSLRRFQAVPGEKNIFTRYSQNQYTSGSPIFKNADVTESLPPSDWDDILSDGEEDKIQPRAQFFDNHVNRLVGGILADRLDPLERTLESMQVMIDAMAAHTLPARRGRTSTLGVLSDADDEDDDESPRLSNTRPEKKLDRIKVIVQEALASASIYRPPVLINDNQSFDFKTLLESLNEMKQSISQSRHDYLGAEEMRLVVKESVQQYLQATETSSFGKSNITTESQLKCKIASPEDKLLQVDDDNQSRLASMEGKLQRAVDQTEEEIKVRRAAEDRLSEIQRLLRLSSEEELRLRNALELKDTKIRKILEENDEKSKLAEKEHNNNVLQISLHEAAQAQAIKNEADLKNKLCKAESELHDSCLQAHRSQMDAKCAAEAARRHREDAEQANETNKDLRRKIDSLRIQMEESTRVRETMRGKLIDLQEDMARAAREITDENSRHVKKEQELIARLEVVDARLHAEGCTRERLEVEIQRLEKGERDGLRAVSECRKLESLVAELRDDYHNAKKDAMRYQREFEEARESGLSEVQRTRNYMQAEIEAANNQVNIVRETLEHQISTLRSDMDHVKLDADTARERSEMLIEEAEMTKKSLISKHELKLADTIEDLQTKHDRQLQNTIEDAHRHEQHLLDRLSLSSVKTDHLQDRVAFLEEKLEIANAAAAAAVTAAKTVRSKSSDLSDNQTSIPSMSVASVSGVDIPEKISPQALRESIMSLQQQLQDREITIESLTSTIASLDPESATKIAKRDDEIMWLRELLAVRKSDLSDIVQSLEQDQWDVDRIKDAAIRLRTNLQMQEQELERAMNGGSALNFPNIAASLRDVASPRVAQAVGPLAAVWGNWRKGRAEMVPIPDKGSSNTPSKNSSGFLGGLLTPPASIAGRESQPTQLPSASGSSAPSQRFTSAQLANRPRVPTRGLPPKRVGMRRELGPSNSTVIGGSSPKTSPILRSIYDHDAIEEEFSDAGFYDEEGSVQD